MVTLSVVLTVFVLNIHHQGNRQMPNYVRRIFIDFFGSYLLVYKKPSELRKHPRKVRLLKILKEETSRRGVEEIRFCFGLQKVPLPAFHKISQKS